MKTGHVFLFISILLLSIGCGTYRDVGAAGEARSLEEQWPVERWEQTIHEFEYYDAKNDWAQNPVEFIGSSSIHGYKTREFFPELDVVNRGFGGSFLRDVNYYFDRIVPKYEPTLIVLYAGENDIAGGYEPVFVLEQFKVFEGKVRGSVDVPILFMAIKPSELRWHLWPQMREANALVRDYIESRPGKGLYYYDAARPVMTAEGKPDASLFRDDKIHLNDDGYALWTADLKPMIDRILASE